MNLAVNRLCAGQSMAGRCWKCTRPLRPNEDEHCGVGDTRFCENCWRAFASPPYVPLCMPHDPDAANYRAARPAPRIRVWLT